MGNCCGGETKTGVVELNNVNKNKDQRLARWKATGTVSVREANLKELPTTLQEVGTAARVLDASINRLSVLPDWLGEFTNLQRLILESNLLTTLPPQITDLNSLKVLVVDSNRLAALPQRIARMTALERISVRGNSLSTLPEGLGELPRLTVLHCSGNRLTELPSSLGGCAALEEIDASGNSLQSLPDSLGSCKRLKVLQLGNNRISRLPPTLFTSCQALQTLSLHGNPITAEVMEETPGYAAFNTRRKHKVDKQITGGVMTVAMDDGVDRPTT